MITRTFKLCLNAGTGSAPYINVSQYDEGETWLFELYSETGERYIPTTGAIVGVKSDGHGIANTGTVDSEGRVVIAETQQMTASAGRAIYELSIDGLTHGTANFIVAVERKPTDDAVMSDSDLSLIQEAIDSAEVIVDVIGDGDPSEVIGEHVDAWLDNHPEATTTVEDGAITAPKINNSLWDKLLVSEEASGNPASFDDGADDVPVSSLKVNLEPIQLGSGDPSPSNIRPIIAANEINQFRPQTGATADGTYNGITFTKNADGSFSFSGTATAGTWFNFGEVTLGADTWTCSVKMEGTYTGTVTFGANNGAFRTYLNLTTYPRTVTSTETTTGNFSVNISNGAVVDMKLWIQIERGSSASAYQPYQGIMVDVKGINRWDEQWELGTYDYNTNTIVKIDDTTHIRSKNPISVDAGKTYYMNTAGYNVHIVVADTGKNVLWRSTTLNNGTFTIPANGAYVYFNAAAAYGTTYKHDISINYPSTTTDYHAYIGISYPYTLGQSVYGGTVDLATGVLTVTHGIVDLGTLTWRYNQADLQAFDTEGIASFVAGGNNAVCSIYPKLGMIMTSTNVRNNDGFFRINKNAAGATETGNFALGVLLIKDTQYTDVATFTAAMSGQYLCYELAEPHTYQLTQTQVKTLLGYNNISSTGTVDVIYHADTKLYVDKMTAVDNNIIAPTEADFVATRNYTVNDLVIVADTLYKVTANIASGSAITPNSNVTQTTLSALIKALS